MRFLLTVVLYCGVLLAPAAHADTRLKVTSKDTAVLGSDALVGAGEHYHHVIVLWGNIDFRGEAEEMVILAGHVKLRSGAHITKSLVVMGGTLDQEDGASVAGDQVTVKAPEGWFKVLALATPLAALFFTGGLWLVTTSFWIFTSWLMGLLLFHLFPGFRDRTRTLMDNHKSSVFLWGLIALLAFVPGFVFLVVSIVGIVLLPLYFAIYGLSWYLAHLVGALWIGETICRLLRRTPKFHWQLLLGLAVSVLVTTSIPVFGKFFLFFVTFLGVGAVWRTWRESFWRPRRALV